MYKDSYQTISKLSLELDSTNITYDTDDTESKKETKNSKIATFNV